MRDEWCLRLELPRQPAERIHHSFEGPPAPGAADPEATMSIFRRVRDEIRVWVGEFIGEWGRH